MPRTRRDSQGAPCFQQAHRPSSPCRASKGTRGRGALISKGTKGHPAGAGWAFTRSPVSRPLDVRFVLQGWIRALHELTAGSKRACSLSRHSDTIIGWASSLWHLGARITHQSQYAGCQDLYQLLYQRLVLALRHHVGFVQHLSDVLDTAEAVSVDNS